MTTDGVEVTTPHPLKGIVNTNDDPAACALCYHPIHDWVDSTVMVCCGKALCRARCQYHHDGKNRNCSLCTTWNKRTPTTTDLANIARKNAKKGHAWAQLEYSLSLVESAPGEAYRWADMAARQGHPGANLNLALTTIIGRGCPVNLTRAKNFAEKALSGGANREQCLEALLLVANDRLREGTVEGVEEALEIFGFLSYGDNVRPEALLWLSKFAYLNGKVEDEYHCLVSCAFAAKEGSAEFSEAAYRAMVAMQAVTFHALGRWWLRRVTLSNIKFDSGEERMEAIASFISYQQELRQMRDICGGCGVEFEGKERKFCRECRTYCYCSRECQKIHWNRKQNGHREDCLVLTDLKKKFKEAKRNSGVIG